MAIGDNPEERSPKRRPKDRRKQIADNAAVLFAERGFHNVHLEDIARASGVTDRALYRHYENKQALLAHVVGLGQAAYDQALSNAATDESEGGAVEGADLLLRLTAAALDTRQLAVLWGREARYLGDGEYRAVRDRVTATASSIVDRISTASLAPLPRPAAELRARAVLGVLASPSHHQLSVPREEFEALLISACEACLRAKSVSSLGPVEQFDSRTEIQMASRREQLLASAASAFRRSGYMAVGIDEIGRPLGIVGPALYRYFDAKVDLLVALSRRLDEWLTLETLRALRVGGGSKKVLRALVTGYVRVAVDDPDLIAVAVTESLHLPQEVSASLKRSANDRDGEWVRCLRSVRPELSDIKARLLVASVTGCINDTVRTPHLLAWTNADRELSEIALAILLHAGGN